MNDNLIYDIPKNKGEENSIRRAKQFFSHRWYPLWEVGKNDKNYLYPARNGAENTVEYTGLPYSSARVENKLVGLDISLNTFMSAVDNPISDFYTRNLSDFDDRAYNCAINNVFFSYGIVCSAFVSYCLDLPLHRSTREIGTAPEFFEVMPRCAKSLNLCDALVTIRDDGSTGGHIRIVTGIARDEYGEIAKVEISESMEPTPKSQWYTKDEFEKTLLGIAAETEKDKYRIFRYRYTDKIGAPVEYSLDKNADIMLNRGDFSNYCEGDEIEFSIAGDADCLVIEDGKNRCEIKACDFSKKEYFGKTYTTYCVSNLACGRYTAHLEKDGKKSASVHFIVAKTPDVVITKKDGTLFEKMGLKPVDADGNPLTASSKCLYAEDGSLNTGIVNIAFLYGERIIPARAAVREKDGKIIVRTAANLLSEDGKITDTFVIGEDTTLYAYSAKAGTDVVVEFSGQNMTWPQYISWKEEAAISFSQRLVTDAEKQNGCLESTLTRQDNNFVSFEIFCQNDYGKLSSSQVSFVV